MRFFVLTVIFLLNACSTIDKRTYYTPGSGYGTLSGPESLYCGITQWGEEPDKLTYQGLAYKANEDTEIYAWGPWLITVIPVFPVTWVWNIFVNPKLLFSITSNERNPYLLPDADKVPLQITLNSGKKETLYAEKSYLKGHTLHLIYPVKEKEVKSFTLALDHAEKAITFDRTARWSWTQICVN